MLALVSPSVFDAVSGDAGSAFSGDEGESDCQSFFRRRTFPSAASPTLTAASPSQIQELRVLRPRPQLVSCSSFYPCRSRCQYFLVCNTNM